MVSSVDGGMFIGMPNDFNTFTDSPESEEKIFNICNRFGKVMLGCVRNNIMSSAYILCLYVLSFDV